MKTYEWILFDADETLIRFDSRGAMQNLFSKLGRILTENDFLEYETINKSLWIEYQDGKITTDQLRARRFTSFGNRFNMPALELDDAFLAEITRLTTPLDGAMDLLIALKGKMKLGVITNGFSKTQQNRIIRAEIKDHIDLIVVSDEVGIAKPHPRIFDHAIEQMGNPPRDKILMVGDTLESDILGGLNARIDTCWLNVKNKTAPAHITPHFQVASLHELEILLAIN